MTTLTRRDVSAERNREGGWVIAAVVNGYRRFRVYYGYTKRDAVRMFVAAVNAGETD